MSKYMTPSLSLLNDMTVEYRQYSERAMQINSGMKHFGVAQN